MSGIVDGRTLTLHLLGGFRITAGHDGVAGLNHARACKSCSPTCCCTASGRSRASTWPSSSGPTPPRSRLAPICVLCGIACAGPCRTPIAFWLPTSSPCSGAARRPSGWMWPSSRRTCWRRPAIYGNS